MSYDPWRSFVVRAKNIDRRPTSIQWPPAYGPGHQVTSSPEITPRDMHFRWPNDAPSETYVGPSLLVENLKRPNALLSGRSQPAWRTERSGRRPTMFLGRRPTRATDRVRTATPDPPFEAGDHRLPGDPGIGSRSGLVFPASSPSISRIGEYLVGRAGQVMLLGPRIEKTGCTEIALPPRVKVAVVSTLACRLPIRPPPSRFSSHTTYPKAV